MNQTTNALFKVLLAAIAGLSFFFTFAPSAVRAEQNAPSGEETNATADGVRLLSPEEVSQLLEISPSDDAALRILMERLALPKKSVIFVSRNTAVVCPVDASEWRINLLIFSIGSSRIENEPSQACKEWIDAAMTDATLDRIEELLAILGREDRDRIINAMIQFLASSRLGISPAHLEMLMIDTRPSSELTEAERADRVLRGRVRMTDLLRLQRERERNQTGSHSASGRRPVDPVQDRSHDYLDER